MNLHEIQACNKQMKTSQKSPEPYIEYTLIFSELQGVLAGVPFFDEVFRQLDCTYVIDSIFPFKLMLPSYSIVEAKSITLA